MSCACSSDEGDEECAQDSSMKTKRARLRIQARLVTGDFFSFAVLVLILTRLRDYLRTTSFFAVLVLAFTRLRD